MADERLINQEIRESRKLHISSLQFCFKSRVTVIIQYITNRMRELIDRWLPLICVVLSLFKDSKCLFMRHAQTGRCVVNGRLGREGAWGTAHYAALEDRCLDDDAQFYYTDTKLLRNKEQKGTFLTRDDTVVYGKRFILYYGKSKDAITKFYNNTDFSLKQTIDGSLFLDQKDYCATGVSDKYLDRAKSCADSPSQKFTFGSVTQFNSKMKDVHCSPVQRMVIKKADYGDFNNSGTFDYNTKIDAKCSSLANCEVKSRCGGKRSCELTFDSNLLPSQYCPDTSKEIYTEYTCVDTINATNIISEPNIRLSDSGSEGFVEIKDGSAWRKVDELKWEKDLQKMLCQHLGFNETDKNDIVRKEVASGQEIASGHLVYNNTQPSGPSSCGTTSSNVNLPYVTCKICDKPALLQDRAMFPDSVFSGSGGSNSYKEARFSNNGWCPTGSGTKYLWIDLQKEYHITQIVTLGDRNQTKWSGSYSLKYSHNESLVNESSTLQITGNQNGYQASSTAVNIYNVRYLKVQSGSTDFCLRIELCGEVLNGPPLNVTFISRGNNSLNVSWKHPHEKLRRGAITGYQVCHYTSGTTPVCQNSTTHSFTIQNLQPSTKYFVTVAAETKFGYGNKSLAISKFTNEDRVNPVATSYYSLGLYLEKPAEYVKEVMVIVQKATSISTPSEDIKTNELKPFKANASVAYVTAYLKIDILPLTFVIGDGKEYNNSDEKTYVNQYLEQNSSYIVFLRFFESKESYYSTKWSSSVVTMLKPQDSQQPKSLSNDETRLDPIIPLVVVSLCFLLLIRVLIYRVVKQRRQSQEELKYKTKMPEISNGGKEESGSIQEAVGTSESIVCDDAAWSDETIYENPDDMLAPNNTKMPEISNSGEEEFDRINAETIPLPPHRPDSVQEVVITCESIEGVDAAGSDEVVYLTPVDVHAPNKTNMAEISNGEKEEIDSVQEAVITCESIEGDDTDGSDEMVYVIPGDVHAPENTRSKLAEQESFTYTSLTDKQESANFCQLLQPPGRDTAANKRKGGDERDKDKERTMEYENPTYNTKYTVRDE